MQDHDFHFQSFFLFYCCIKPNCNMEHCLGEMFVSQKNVAQMHFPHQLPDQPLDNPRADIECS